MAELFKNIYNEKFFSEFTNALLIVVPDFDSNSFSISLFNEEWEQLELKQRMRHITYTLNSYIPGSFQDQVTILLKTIQELQNVGRKETSIEFMFLPDFIEVYGIEEYATSIHAFEIITQFTSCEFAVRPFIIKHPERMIDQMKTWSKHKQATVRRLSTEGCRPRLPWAMAIPFLKKNPASIVSILEHLKNDVSESVRRSVANNLNDIAKDNPEVVLRLAKKWKGESTEVDWLVKHACRTLLKQGGSEVMQLFGFGSVAKIDVSNFEITTPIVSIGGSLEFNFQLKNNSNKELKLRLEYGLYYQKANGSLAKKVFKISEKMYSENSLTTINRKQSFKIITTRKFHIGKHQVSIIINGVEFSSLDFELTN
jgi:3-methyladenine DNA glycosylase AlkC